MSYEFHNDGYLRLAPCTPYERRIAVTTIADSNVVEIFGMELGAEQKGQYICITHDDDTSEWRKILSVQDPYHAVVDINMPTTETFEDCLIATVNEIHVEGEGVELTKLEIEYIPQVR